MSVVIRLARAGAKHKPYFHIVAADSRMPRDGRRIEAIGTYDPRPEPPRITLDEERLAQLLGTGARPSATVTRLVRWYKKRAAQTPAAPA